MNPKLLRILKFVGGYCLVILAFYLIYYSGFYEQRINPSFLEFQAWVSFHLLGIFENSLSLNGNIITSPVFSYALIRGCDGLEGWMIFLAAIIVFPVEFKFKWGGLIFGTLALFFINHIRIIILYYVGVYNPEYFEFAHHNIGFVLYSMASILMLLLWVEWVRKRKKPTNLA